MDPPIGFFEDFTEDLSSESAFMLFSKDIDVNFPQLPTL